MSRPESPKAIEWPMAYSNKQAAEALGWPEPLVRQCKKMGCPGYVHGRWKLGELVAFVPNLFSGGTPITDPARDYKTWQALNEKLRYEKAKGEAIPEAEVRTDAQEVQAVLFSELERIFVHEFPGLCKGLSEIEIHQHAKRAVEKFRESIREKIQKLGPQASEAKPQ